MGVKPLTAKQVYRQIPPRQFRFSSSEEQREPGGVLGQDRAVEALEFGLTVRQSGYNLFVLGPPASGRHTIVQQVLEARAAKEPQPDDWVYVHNFDTPHKPNAIRLPHGKAVSLRDDMRRFVEEVSVTLPGMFETDEYRSRREAIDTEFKEKQEKAFGAIGEEAQGRNLALIRTPQGLALAPMQGEEVMPPEHYRKLPDLVRKKIEADIEELQGRLQATMQQLPEWERDRRRQLRELNREISRQAVSRLIEPLRRKYEAIDEVGAYLEAVQADVINHADAFLQASAGEGGEAQMPGLPPAVAQAMAQQRHAQADATAQMATRRYQINIMVGDGGAGHAPVVGEQAPTYANLIGRIEHMAEMGALLTDYTMIKPGALHRANGGYLYLDAVQLLQQPYAWDGLKRALRAQSISIESPGQMMSLVSTISLEPEPIPLQVKVVLIGDPRLYYMLCRLDPDFGQLFKVQAEFEPDLTLSKPGLQQFARLLGSVARGRGLRGLNPEGMARVSEHALRLGGDVEKLSLQVGKIGDLLTEADYWAERNDSALIGRTEVQQAIEAQARRSDRIAARMQAAIENDTILVDTDGAVVGQINGLAVLDMGNFAFGKPNRITARVRLGGGEVIDIERRVELGGPLHSKGVLILSAFLGARYAAEHPLSLSASLVFEQSYGGVDGDSASSAELYALLSALSELPIDQGFAVTGSVNQRGQVQAIGGVNEKIEGFFDLCVARGLTGRQGVLIPQANVRHLMLKPAVVDAVKEGRFRVFPIRTIDEGIEILTGTPAGKPGKSGVYPKNSVNRLVQDRVLALAELRRSFARRGQANNNGDAADKPDAVNAPPRSPRP